MKNVDFRDLFYELHNYEGDAAYRDVLLPAQDTAQHIVGHVRHYGEIGAKALKIGRREELNHELLNALHHLYALSRVNDVMLMAFTEGSHGYTGWQGPQFSVDERSKYLTALGMHLVEREMFHPFYHEIVEVEQSPDIAEPITLVKTIWPCFMLGQMMFSRAGVKVRGGSEHIVKEIAENSTLYWAYARKTRRTDDRSMGWGSNSQWRTKLRRDYEDDKAFYYNVDGKLDVHLPPPPPPPRIAEREPETLPLADRIELITHRCFIKSDKPHVDILHYFTYTSTHIEKKL
jgi:hypothetical protein